MRRPPSFNCAFDDEPETFIERTAFIGRIKLQGVNAIAFRGRDCIFHQTPRQPLPPIFRPGKDHADPCQPLAVGKKAPGRNDSAGLLDQAAALRGELQDTEPVVRGLVPVCGGREIHDGGNVARFHGSNCG
jgi:hypothetical protein